MLNVHSYLTENEILKIIEKYDVHNIALHEKKVASYSISLFNFINQYNQFSLDDKNFLKYSALLHDIGYFIHKENHHKHTKYIILEEPILNKLPAETRFLLAAVASSHGSFIDSSIEFSSDKLKLLKLLALLRIADALDHTHNLNISLKQIKLKNETLKIKITGEGSEHILKKIKKKSNLFSKVYGLPVCVKCY